MKTISFELSEEEHAAVVHDADAAGLAKSPYCRQVLQKRHEKQLVITPNDERLVAKLEGKIETLTEQLGDANNRLAKKTEQAGLAGLEKRNNVNETTLHEYGQKLKQEWQAELDQRELLELRQFKQQAETRIQELEDHKASNDKFDKALSGIKEVVSSNPVILTGLMGMVGMKLPGADVPGLGSTPEDERALRIGRAVINDIDPTIQDELMIVLNHLSKKPGDIAAIIRTKPFADARKLAMAEQQSA